jgi:16S rRNA (guanine527-N7)-methyltransferase
MDQKLIATWLRPFLRRDLSATQLERVSIYVEVLLKWNARINLTSIRSEQEIVTRHFGESFFLAQSLCTTQAQHQSKGRAANAW